MTDKYPQLFPAKNLEGGFPEPSSSNYTVSQMSGTLFSTKSHRSSRHLRKLSISSPLHVTPPTELAAVFPTSRPPVWTVILTAKYNFEALGKPEMSLQKGDHVRLLDRPGNGWLKVQRIHEIGEGLVPALYLEISVNDPHNPVSSEWLNDYQEQASKRNRVSLVKVKSAYLSPCNNYWYRMDVVFNSGRTTCCAMFYEDFVSLHQLVANEGPIDASTPELPQNHLAVSINLRHTMRGEAVARSQASMVLGLDKFMQSVLRMVQCHSSNLLGDYIDNHCTRKVHVRQHELFPSDEAVASSLVDGLARATRGQAPTRNNSFSPTAPLPPILGTPGSLNSMGSVSRLELVSCTPHSPYLASNLKYLSYLNQNHGQSHNQSHNQSLLLLSHHSLTAQTKEQRQLAIRRRVISLNSVIDSYANESSDNESEAEKDNANPLDINPSGRNVFEAFESELVRLVSRSTSQKLGSPCEPREKDAFSAQMTGFKSLLKTGSSEYGSECNFSSVTASTDSYEPRTPTLSHPQVHPSVKVLSEYDLSPLEPKKHHAFFGSAGDDFSLGTKFSWDPLPHQ